MTDNEMLIEELKNISCMLLDRGFPGLSMCVDDAIKRIAALDLKCEEVPGGDPQ